MLVNYALQAVFFSSLLLRLKLVSSDIIPLLMYFPFQTCLKIRVMAFLFNNFHLFFLL